MAQSCTCNNQYGPPMEINFGTTVIGSNGEYTTQGADAGYENILCNGCNDCCGKAGYGNSVSATNLEISKTRGVPSQGSIDKGPRGQRMSFRSFDGTKQGSSNVGQMVLGYLAIGLTAFVVGYSLMKGKEKAN
ncbi:hypothetical protein N8587_01455 [Akkermansiaceae bacterium]|nr:hypothetical protein [Akkermansiaceae bacterium]